MIVAYILSDAVIQSLHEHDILSQVADARGRLIAQLPPEYAETMELLADYAAELRLRLYSDLRWFADDASGSAVVTALEERDAKHFVTHWRKRSRENLGRKLKTCLDFVASCASQLEPGEWLVILCPTSDETSEQV